MFGSTQGQPPAAQLSLRERVNIAISRIREATAALIAEARKVRPEDAHREEWSVIRTLQHLSGGGYLALIKSAIAGERPTRRIPPTLDDALVKLAQQMEEDIAFYQQLSEEQLGVVALDWDGRQLKVVDIIENQAQHIDEHRRQIAEIRRRLEAE